MSKANVQARGDHAVVAARLDSDWIILDSRLQMLKNSEMRRMVPLFVLDKFSVTQVVPAKDETMRSAWEPAKDTATPASL